MNLKHVVGPPGTGKTHRLMSYMEQLLARRVEPADICFSSFTRAAIDQARKRMHAQFGIGRDDLPYFGTMHSMAYRVLGIRKDNVFSGRHWRLFCEAQNLKFTEDRPWADDDPYEPLGQEEGDILRRFYDWHRNLCIPLSEALRQFDPPSEAPWSETRAAWFVRAIEQYKLDYGLYDFTDMLLELDKCGWYPPARVLAMDEAQDLSPLQQRIAMRWAVGVGNVLLAYDPDQAIYGFQGASPEWLLALDGAREHLEQSFRVPRLPAQVAQRIISRNRIRYPSTWLPRDAPGSVEWDADLSSVVSTCARDRDPDWYFLARNRYFLEAICAELREQGVPYHHLRGPSPVAPAAVVVALQLASGLSVSLDDLRRMAEKTAAKEWWEHGAKAKLDRAMMDGRAQEKVSLADLPDHGARSDLVGALNTPQRCMDPLKIADGTKGFFFRVWQRFGFRGLTDPPGRMVSTMHGVKGGEARDVVMSVDMTRRTADGYEQDPEPERRVWYVGASRTSQNLYILEPTRSAAFDEW